MRKNSLLLAFLLIGFAACLSEREVKVSLDVPAPAALGPAAIPALRLAGFYQEKEAPEFDLGSVLTTYFRDELKPLLKGPVEIKPVAFENAGSLKSRDFWKTAAGEDKKSIILSGQAQFTQETRKALLEGERGDFDGPFKPQSPWSARKNFSLKLDLVLIDPASGEPVFQKEFQESITSENLKQTAEFATYDLLQRIKLKLLRALFGSERSLQRYLLTK